MSRFLLLSNGHGEDLSGSLIAQSLQGLGHQVEAMPFVGRGSSYKEAGIKIIGKTKEFSTGGLGYTTLRGRLTEIFQGQVFYLLGRLVKLLYLSRKYDLLVVVGDVVPIVAAWLTRVPAVAYLVAYSSHYEGKLILPWPSAHCLSSRYFLGIFSRDEFTAIDLSNQLRRSVVFLGNPFIEPVLIPKAPLQACKLRLGILPGSRRPELDRNLISLLRVLEFFPDKILSSGDLSLDIALVNSLGIEELFGIVNSAGWDLKRTEQSQTMFQLCRGKCKIHIHRDSFVAVLQSSDVLLCMAGTATEQAVGLSKPVVQLPGQGPQFTVSFAEAQRRLLGPTVFCADCMPDDPDVFCETASLAIKILERSQIDLCLQSECDEQARQRIGRAGGATAMAKLITDLTDSL